MTITVIPAAVLRGLGDGWNEGRLERSPTTPQPDDHDQ